MAEYRISLFRTTNKCSLLDMIVYPLCLFEICISDQLKCFRVISPRLWCSTQQPAARPSFVGLALAHMHMALRCANELSEPAAVFVVRELITTGRAIDSTGNHPYASRRIIGCIRITVQGEYTFTLLSLFRNRSTLRFR